MRIGRLWRTISPLSASQLTYRVYLRARRRVMARFPHAARRRAEARAMRLPLPDFSSPAMADIGEIVLSHQNAVHGEYLDGITRGRFVLHNQAFDFGAIEEIQWRGDFREGANPLRRMTLAYMGYVPPLLARGRAEDLAVVNRLLTSFEAGNQWHMPGVLGDNWHPYAASHRLINLLAGLALYGKAGGPKDEAIENQIQRHARLCAAHISANLERDVQFNHLMKNLVALSVYHGALAADVHRSVAQCVLGDGGHAERSPMYHLLALLDVRMLRACGLQPEIVDRMEAALRVMTHPDGEIALFNDSWVGEAPPPSEILAPGDVAEIATLDITGYTRLSGGKDAIIFDHGLCGPDDNPAHGHGDFLSVELSAEGQRLIVDTGVATYTAGDMRDATRSAASHNGPHVMGEDTLEHWGSFRVGWRARAGALDDPSLAAFAPLHRAGWHDGYRSRGVMARRFIGLWPGEGALICDLWRGGADAPGICNFLFPATWKLMDESPLVLAQEQTSVRVTALAGKITKITASQTWPRFEAPESAHKITLTPDISDTDLRAALWLSWGDSLGAPDGETLARLFDALTQAEGGS